MRAALATVAGGERTGERRGPRPQFRTEPAAPRAAGKRSALPSRQAAGEARQDNADSEEQEEELCWSSEGEEEDAEPTVDVSLVETVRAQQRNQWESGGASGSEEARSWDRTRAVAGRSPSSLQDSILARISTLKALCDQGFISADEYERCGAALLDFFVGGGEPHCGFVRAGGRAPSWTSS